MNELEQLKADVAKLKEHAHKHDLDGEALPLKFPKFIPAPADFLMARTPRPCEGETCEAKLEAIIKDNARTGNHKLFALHAAIAIMKEIKESPRKYLGEEIDNIEEEWRNIVAEAGRESASFTEKYNNVCSEAVDLHKDLARFKRYYTELTSQNGELRAENEGLEKELHDTKVALERIRNDRNKLIDGINAGETDLFNALNTIAHQTSVCCDYDRAEACQKIARDALRNRYKG